MNSYFNEQTLIMSQYDYNLLKINDFNFKPTLYLGYQDGYIVDNTLLPDELIFGKDESMFGALGGTIDYKDTLGLRLIYIPGFIGCIFEIKFNFQ